MIKLYINEKNKELDNWNILIKKTTQAEAKAKIQVFVSCTINQHYYKSSQLIHIITAKANIQAIKNFWPEKPKTQGPKLFTTIQHFNNLEFSKT